jgi:GGDEF domain-containing protein
LADAPVDALLSRAAELARDWLLATLADAPVDMLSTLPAADFARRAPELCGALCRALSSDTELARLGVSGDLRALGAEVLPLAGAHDPAAGIAAVERLRRVLLRGALDEVRGAEAELAVGLADRLAYACSLVAGAGSSGARAAVGSSTAATGESPADPLEVLDTWLADAGRAGRPLALLLAELDDRGRLDLIEGSAAPGGGLSRQLLDAARTVMRDSDAALAGEEGRVWLIADGVTRPGAEAIARRLEGAVRALGSWRGAPLTAAVGVALHPHDGQDAAALAAAAEEGVFAAAAAGTGGDGLRPPL